MSEPPPIVQGVRDGTGAVNCPGCGAQPVGFALRPDTHAWCRGCHCWVVEPPEEDPHPVPVRRVGPLEIAVELSVAQVRGDTARVAFRDPFDASITHVRSVRASDLTEEERSGRDDVRRAIDRALRVATDAPDQREEFLKLYRLLIAHAEGLWSAAGRPGEDATAPLGAIVPLPALDSWMGCASLSSDKVHSVTDQTALFGGGTETQPEARTDDSGAEPRPAPREEPAAGGQNTETPACGSIPPGDREP